MVLAPCGGFFGSPAARAQLPPYVERCLPYPTYAQEVDAIFREPEPFDGEPAPPRRTFVVDSVSFDGPITLPEQARLKLVHDLRAREFEGDPDGAVPNEIAEVDVRGAWQDEGYFKAVATVTARDRGGDEFRRHISLTVHIHEGLRYTMGRLAFRSSDPDQPLVFTERELREKFPLKDGEVFDADKVRVSLDAYRQLYGALGYADFTAEPDFQANDAKQDIDLTLVLDQQKQFRITQVQVDNLGPQLAASLRSIVRPGDIFNHAALEKFFADNKAALPPGASIDQNARIMKNVKEGTVSVRLDFFACPNLTN